MDNLFGLDRPSLDQKEVKFLTTVYDNGSLSVIRSLLDSGDVPYIMKERGSGSAVKIFMGYSMYGTDIYVRPEDYECASALITVPEDDDSEDEGSDMDMDNDTDFD